MISKFIKITVVGIAALQLSACAGFNKSYGCKPNKGVPCKTITEINAMVTNNTLPGVEGELLKAKSVANAAPKTKSNAGSSNATLNLTDSSAKIDVVRVPEETMLVLVSPYEDEKGTYHHANNLHVVVKHAYWQTRGE